MSNTYIRDAHEGFFVVSMCRTDLFLMLTDNSLSQVEIEYKLLKRGLLKKWLMYLWDKLTDCSLSPHGNFKCKLCYFAIIFKTTLTDNSLSQVEIEYKLLKRGLLTKWLMYLWDKLTDCSLSPIVDFFGGVTRLHIAYRAKVFLKIAKSVSELSGSDLIIMKTEKCYLFWKSWLAYSVAFI